MCVCVCVSTLFSSGQKQLQILIYLVSNLMRLMPDQLVPVAVHMALFEYELLQQKGANKLA